MLREAEAEVQGKKPESTMFDTWKGKRKFLDGGVIESKLEEPTPQSTREEIPEIVPDAP